MTYTATCPACHHEHEFERESTMKASRVEWTSRIIEMVRQAMRSTYKVAAQ